jgi:1-acyl-sn-glycerol-3-phosphate acyltransferase
VELSYRAAVVGLRTVFAALWLRITVIGEEHLPASGPAVVAANHIGYLDFALLGYLGRRRGRFVRFLAKSGVFEAPVVGALMRAMRHVPVDREQGAGALREAEHRLAAGEVVGVYAEGTISRSFQIKPLARGAAAMALSTGAPLVPVVTFGGHRVVTVDGRRSLRWGTPVTIRVGPPVPVHGDADAVTARLGEHLAALLDEVIADYPIQPGAWWVPAAYGGSAPPPEVAARLDEEALARLRDRRAARRGQAS